MASSTSGINEIVNEYAPWRKGVAWWVVLVQGLVLLAIGVAALVWPSFGHYSVLIGLGAWLVISAIWTVIQAIRGRNYGMSVFNLMAAGGGLVAGVSVLLPFLFTGQIDTEAAAPRALAFFTFGVSLAIVGLFWALSSLIERPQGGIAVGTLLRGIVFAGLGVYIVYAVVTGPESLLFLQWVAIALAVLGGLLVLWSIVLQRRGPSGAAA